ncbi:hypothetical protein SPHINGOAX6_30130 [Sphingomonas sp. AX6]|nr:hypothetical protein SPHINGOAX6_30130 [Sphingomonas sp. AX6]
MIQSTGEHIVIGCSAAALQPRGKAPTRVSGNFELHRPTSLLLDYHSASPNILPGYETADPQLHEVAAPQLAIDGKVKQRAISQPLLSIKKEADRPDLLLRERSLRANRFTGIPGHAVLHDGIQIRSSSFSLAVIGQRQKRTTITESRPKRTHTTG